MSTGKLKRIWPQAIRIEGPYKCPVCSHFSEWSFVLPEFDTRWYGPDQVEQAVGFYCSMCGWSNSGYREATTADIEQDGIGE
jgi:hypothetical protein